MALPFEFCIEGPPVSQQANKKARCRDWRNAVRSAAMSEWDSSQPIDGPVAVTISYIYEDASLDVDNVPKPILDALKNLVYPDDDQVFDLACHKRSSGGKLAWPNATSLLRQHAVVRNEFLHVLVDRADVLGGVT
ncbi:RusA family crossover junction endodeoxyribonuclease [Candidatus Poriferisodalis sp.]|uniref:RusA family crossover junction endodeoxyribonuclease n=1 Tax=Candidatus Poriferisodalis sp. TaxID=3101277 RepID=UPI003C6FA609